MKNECAKMRPVTDPYEVWQSADGSWTWKVLKKWQGDDDKEYARWFCSVSSPIVGSDEEGGGELGDVYVSEIKSAARRIDAGRPIAVTPLTEGVEPEVSTKHKMMTATWELSSVPGEYGPTRECVDLTVFSHHPERKCYSASIQRVTRSRGEHFESTAFTLFSGVNILVERDAPRFSAKGLREFYSRALAELRARSGDPAIEAVFSIEEPVEVAIDSVL